MRLQVTRLGIVVMSVAPLIRVLRALTPTLRITRSFSYSNRASTFAKKKDSMAVFLIGNQRNIEFRSRSSSSIGASTDIDINDAAATAGNRFTPRRIKIINVSQQSDEIVLIKGWVKTVRKQKTLAFVEVNDGSTLSGIQCVLPFDDIDESTKNG